MLYIGVRVDPVNGDRIQKGTVAETGASFLQISRVTHRDQGVYTCQIRTAIGTSESTYNLRVTGPSMYSLCV